MSDFKLSNFLENAINLEYVSNGVVAQDETQIKHFWSIREIIPESLSQISKVYKYDVSLPVSKLYNLVSEVRRLY